ncbi:MFS multidrug transporter [Colletotrichum musicola]|uniref:MFS multidrug transporter n=1 Tax=Colletotrichum musicola TaxID=2175873 RepID=A0A8H6KVP6_9PEZI|nr:MFS multidrug transporter [Colletotrichum musicola]
MTSFLVSAVFLVGLYILYYWFCLFRNIQSARTIGIPVVWSPVSPFNPLWIVLNKRLSPLIRRLPFGIGKWTRYNSLDWTWVDRAHGACYVHETYGDTFAHATPREIEIHTRDPAVADEVLRRKSTEFPKISHYAKVLDFFGTSLVSSDGEDWNRHRKATVATLSDRNNRLVWAESARQAQQMIDYYHATSDDHVVDPVEDIRELYLHVFTGVCFGYRYDFKQPADKCIAEDHTRSYKDCLHTSLSDLLILRLVPQSVLNLPKLPRRLENFREATIEMRQYLDEMIESSKQNLKGGLATWERTKTDNLLSFMVKSSREAEIGWKAAGLNNPKRSHLTDSEIRGNLFTYSLGGHESSAHTLIFALYLLVGFPQHQDWLIEEIDAVLEENKEWKSEEAFMEVFPRLKRCQAVMLETLRLYPSVTVLPKCTGSASATLFIEGIERRVPPRTNVFVNMPSIQVHRPIWGADSKVWNPSRWISTTEKGLQAEQVISPPDAAFLPWSEGKRACPGKRFSQVGFVAALVALLYNHRIEVVPRDGESLDHARKRVSEVVENTYAVLTVNMYEPLSVQLRMCRRK